MSKTHRIKVASATVATCLALTPACHDDAHEPAPAAASDDDPGGETQPSVDGVAASAHAQEGYTGCEKQPFDPGQLEFIPLDLIEDIFIRRLPDPTELGEDVAIHVRLPDLAAGDPTPQPNLLRVVGSVDAPVLMFNSDALVELGHLDESPGKGFFTTFAHIDEVSLNHRAELEQMILQNGEVSEVSMVIEGRQPIALSAAEPFDLEGLENGNLVRLGRVRILPVSADPNWLESVFVTDPAVVQDPERTYDTCTQEGNACGPWTFCHLMTEMANTPRTGISREEFTKQWLEQWLSAYTVNDDTVDAREQMWDLVIEPWLSAGGGELDLERAPFRLLAIVNRLDLRRSSSGGFGYGGQAGGLPVDAGELRFVFGVMAPDGSGAACEALPFTVIFEYGVPIGGCLDVVQWANRWVGLDTMGGFGASYRAELESMTELVVKSDAAPKRGNGSAINQIRTNENALDKTWELREFTLSDQELGCKTFKDIPNDGFLRPHTVAQTPDDAVHAPTPSGVLDDFVSQIACGSHTVPVSHDCAAGDPVPLLGANSLASLVPGGPVPGAWLATPSGSDFVCRRHQVSLNTCNGCHTCDTATEFTHVSPTSGIPAQLSGFLLGTTAQDTQFSGVHWTFADLDRRYQDLYQVAGAMCFPQFPVVMDFFDVLGFDPLEPVIDPAMLDEIFNARLELSNLENMITPVLEDFNNFAPPVH